MATQKTGRHLEVENFGYEGGLDRPMSWDRVLEKLLWLKVAAANKNFRRRLIQAAQ